jgi:hypothetical protein
MPQVGGAGKRILLRALKLGFGSLDTSEAS